MPSLESTTATAAHERIGLPGDELPLGQTEFARKRGCSVRTLERERAEGRGPPWFEDGARIKYWWSEYRAYTARRTRGGDRDTAEPTKRRPGRPRKHDLHREDAGV
jgi:hypothetical protein